MNFVKFTKKCYDNNQGYIVLVTVLIVGAVGISIAVAMILLGLGQTRSEATADQLNQTKALANACAEEGLQQVRTSDSYTGGGSLTLDNGTCTYLVLKTGNDSREIQATGTIGDVSRKVKITTDSLHPTINIVSWQELSDF